jgi:CRP-like cAMP-binding protein
MSVFGLRADAELRELLRNYSSQSVRREAQSCIFHEGQQAHGFYLIIRGKARLYMEATPGKKVMERVVGEGCLIGLPATVSGHPYSLTCEVVENVELAYLSLRDFSNLMNCEAEAAMKLLGLLSNEVQAARAEIARSPKSTSAAISVVN